MRKKRQTTSRNSKNDISDFIEAAKIIKVNPKTLGVILCSLSITVLLSIISYSSNDITGWSSINEILSGNKDINNWLGIIGANISRFFFMNTFGYVSVIFPIWFLYIGIKSFKQVSSRLFFPKHSFLYVQTVFLLAILLAFPESYRTTGHSISYFPSGAISGVLSDVLVRMFGKTGSVIVLVSYSIALIILYLPKGMKLKFNFKLPKFSMPKVELDRDEKMDDDFESTSDIVVIDQDEEDVSTEFIPEEKIVKRQKRASSETKKLNTFQKKIPEIAIAEPEPTVSAQIDEIIIEQSPEQEVTFVQPIEQNNFDVSLDDVLDNIPDEQSNLSHLFETELGKKEEQNRQSSEHFMNTVHENTPVMKAEPEPIILPKIEVVEERFQTPKVILSEPSEDLEASDVSFTVEEAVEEKESNLDKAQKKIGKRERYQYPSIELLDNPPEDKYVVSDEELWANAKILEDKLLDFKVSATVSNVISGPVITMFELKPDLGVRVSKIETLMPDISLSLSAKGIRFLGQVPGRDTLGIEIPNAHRKLVTFKEIINSEKFVNSDYDLPVVLGKGVSGEIIVADLASMPHVLIAGATGSGKSVGVNAMIISLLYKKHPDDIKFVMIDPKMIELSLYNKLENHHLAYSTDLDEKVVTTSENALSILYSVVEEMENRYRTLKNVSVRNIKEYNDRVAGKRKNPDNEDSDIHEKMPYVVVVIDELADLMMTTNKAVEEPIARLTQKARAVGIHCIIATQRPSVDVITGIIKANVPTRIAFQTASKIDSRTILDLMGAEQLLGRGDMLYLPPGQAKPLRIQNSFLSTEETEEVVQHVANQPFSKRLDLKLANNQTTMNPKMGTAHSGVPSTSGSGIADDLDPLYEKAKELIVVSGTGSTSYIQRRLKVGYARAGRIMDQLEDAGVVGPPNGSSPRDVYMGAEELGKDTDFDV